MWSLCPYSTLAASSLVCEALLLNVVYSRDEFDEGKWICLFVPFCPSNCLFISVCLTS